MTLKLTARRPVWETEGCAIFHPCSQLIKLLSIYSRNEVRSQLFFLLSLPEQGISLKVSRKIKLLKSYHKRDRHNWSNPCQRHLCSFCFFCAYHTSVQLVCLTSTLHNTECQPFYTLPRRLLLRSFEWLRSYQAICSKSKRFLGSSLPMFPKLCSFPVDSYHPGNNQLARSWLQLKRKDFSLLFVCFVFLLQQNFYSVSRVFRFVDRGDGMVEISGWHPQSFSLAKHGFNCLKMSGNDSSQELRNCLFMRYVLYVQVALENDNFSVRWEIFKLLQ